MHFETLSGKHLTIALVTRSDSLRQLIADTLRDTSTISLSHATEALNALAHPDWRPDIVLLDIEDPERTGEILANLTRRLPDTPVVAFLSGDAVGTEAEVERLGVATLLTLPVAATALRRSLLVAERMLDLRVQLRQWQAAAAGEVKFEQIVARTSVMQNVVGLLRKACLNDINILLEGEEGTGKEFFARAVHFNGTRASGPFVLINCAAVPRHLLERDLFGSEAGVFGEGSDMLAGAIEQADGGTLLIDEIGEMEVPVQARLFRCLQSRSFRRVGGETDLPLNARIVTSTSLDLRALCREGRFRDDLYFRLATFPIRVPALRDRIADIPVLAERLVRQYAENQGRPGLGISPEAMLLLRKYRWPGNISELKEVIERSVTVCESMEIRVNDLPHPLLVATGVRPKSEGHDMANGKGTGVPTMDQLKARGVRLALEASNGNIKEAARLLDIGRTTIYKLIERYNIPV